MPAEHWSSNFLSFFPVSMVQQLHADKKWVCRHREVALMERQRREADLKQKQALKGFLG